MSRLRRQGQFSVMLSQRLRAGLNCGAPPALKPRKREQGFPTRSGQAEGAARLGKPRDLCFLFDDDVQGKFGGNMFGATVAELGEVEPCE